jgi:hypothetical protein
LQLEKTQSVLGSAIAISIAMTTYFGLWKLNTNLQPPADPKLELQQNLVFQSMIKEDLRTGDVKEAHAFLEGAAGYFLTGDITEEKLHEVLVKWYPYIQFELHKTIPILKSIETTVNVSRARASALTVPA